jgi:hypothetical protein
VPTFEVLAAPPMNETVAIRPAGAAPAPRAVGDRSDRLGGRARRWVFGVAALAIAATAAWGVEHRMETPVSTGMGDATTSTPDRYHPPQSDVSLLACTSDPAGAHASGAVVNHASYTANYVIGVEVADDEGHMVTSQSAVVPEIAAGDSLGWAATMPPKPSTAAHASCRITSVDRFRVPQR